MGACNTCCQGVGQEIAVEECKDNFSSELQSRDDMLDKPRTFSKSVGAAGFTPLRLATNLPLYDLQMYDEEQGFWPNIANYYSLCMCANFFVTLSCFSVWNKNKKVNSNAKIIPALKNTVEEHVESARVFFFDDNLNLDDGSSKGAGICNLRDVSTGEFVDFNQGKNGFVREHFARHTVIHHSNEYKAVLVQANILDAMEDEEYFTKMLAKYSLPNEKLLVFMDVNSTIVCVDTVTSKTTSQIILGTMFEFVEVKPNKPFEFAWEGRTPVKVDKPTTMKALAKKASGDDKKYYDQFYEEERCVKFWAQVAESAELRWVSLKDKEEMLSWDQFHKTFKEYIATCPNGADERGVTKSWYVAYQHLQKTGQRVCLNSFGIDTKTVVSHTVPQVNEVMHVTINHGMWDERDQKKFDEAYGVKCRRQAQPGDEAQAA